MKAEAWLFTGTSLFFGATTVVYRWFSTDPAGSSALCVSFIMSGLVAAFLWRQHRRGGERPEDRGDAEVLEASGRRIFFPDRSYYPVLTAVGAALSALGVVQGLWLFLIGFGVLAAGIFGFAFQNLDHPE
ncbi:cytochrome c oxidase subunit IV [Streptomyces sp. 3211.6]|uniref:aa3-type cytochrome oxidase subunit IV n=1 Tax=Streptomyces TaxID=1883 RepID=UPI0009A4DD39|nr:MULTISPECIES: cytochrome c oxidase subunit 4 [Streptomyces]RKT06627.1 cytochrome c oxidase subunit IV [Streptomyces sp. 3211.6]RPF45835.1 cytochrome c oxidase subunit IV [Streptomyces sp. Ag109_G2-6]